MPDERTPERILFDEARVAFERFLASTNTDDLPAIFHLALVVEDKDEPRAYRVYPIRCSKEQLEKYK